jgi:uncharacterized delta-60 repeat protein
MWTFFSSSAAKGLAKRGRGRCFRPQVEVLEDRYCLSPGSLQWSDPDIVNLASVYSVVAQPSGKIVLVGGGTTATFTTFTLAELDSNGALDPSFGSGGIVYAPKSNTATVARDAVLYPTGSSGDEKILAAGEGWTSTFALVRYNADGSLDASFGNHGYVGTTFKQKGSAYGLVLVPNGTSLPKIVVAGNSADNTAIELARYNPDGSLDQTFGSKGTVYNPIPGMGGVSKVALDPVSGDLIVNASPLLVAFTSDGTLDSSFGQNGVVSNVLTNGYSNSGALAVYPAADMTGNAGKILVGGNGGVARYMVNGTLDMSWGGTGIVPVPRLGIITDLAIQPDDKVVVARLWSVIRFNTDGSLDGSFGSGGVASAGLGSAIPPHWDLTLLPNGDIVEAGSAWVGGNSAFAAVCYLPSAPQIGSFTANPNPITAGTVTTLTASNLTDANPGATITQVAFYAVDSSGNSQVLGYGTQTSPGVWTFTFSVNLASGTYTLLAQAEDSYGVFGLEASLTLQVT